MPGMLPLNPEIVTYDEYHEMRDDCLKPLSLVTTRPYTIRLRRQPDATREHFAYDTVSIISKVKNLGAYSVVWARIKDYNNMIVKSEFGVNVSGMIFNHKPLPNPLDPLDYKSEVGYFVSDSGDMDSSGGAEIGEEEIAEDEVIKLRQHLALTH